MRKSIGVEKAITKVTSRVYGIVKYSVVVCHNKRRIALGGYYNIELARAVRDDAYVVIKSKGILPKSDIVRIRELYTKDRRNNPVVHKQHRYSMYERNGYIVAYLKINKSMMHIGYFTSDKYAKVALREVKQFVLEHGSITREDIKDIKRIIVQTYPNAMSARSKKLLGV